MQIDLLNNPEKSRGFSGQQTQNVEEIWKHFGLECLVHCGNLTVVPYKPRPLGPCPDDRAENSVQDSLNESSGDPNPTLVFSKILSGFWFLWFLWFPIFSGFQALLASQVSSHSGFHSFLAALFSSLGFSSGFISS